MSSRCYLDAGLSEPVLHLPLDAAPLTSVGPNAADVTNLNAAVDPSANGAAITSAGGASDARLAIQPELLATAMAARTDDNRVILTSGTAADMLLHLPLMIRSLRLASFELPHHLVVVTLTAKALRACRVVHNWCVLDSREDSAVKPEDWDLDLPSSDPRVQPGGSAALALTVRKFELLRDLLAAGFDVVWTDIDVVGFKNFLLDGVLDYASGAEVLVAQEYLDPARPAAANPGFFFLRSSAATQALVAAWLQGAAGGAAAREHGLLDKLLDPATPSAVVDPTRVGRIDAAAVLSICGMMAELGSGSSLQDFSAGMKAKLEATDVVLVHTGCWHGPAMFPKSHAMLEVVDLFLKKKWAARLESHA